MTTDNIFKSLCAYDKRNPDCIFDDEEIKDHNEDILNGYKACYCDNCFYGRTELALELLKHIDYK